MSIARQRVDSRRLAAFQANLSPQGTRRTQGKNYYYTRITEAQNRTAILNRRDAERNGTEKRYALTFPITRACKRTLAGVGCGSGG